MSSPLLETRRLSFSYPDGQVALTGVSLRIEAGESVAMIGPNGAGKSTLLLHLNGILPWSSRSYHANGHTTESSDQAGVFVEGCEVCRSSLGETRRRVGLLFQDPNDQLFCTRLIEDVAFGPRNFGHNAEEARRIATDCLKRVGLMQHENRVPHQLSFGEKKLASLATVLACNPDVLALDEPTSNLDPRARRQFINLLRSLGNTKIIATHDMEMVLDICTRTILIDQGTVIADGQTRELLSNPELLEAHGLEQPLSMQYGKNQKTGLYEERASAGKPTCQ